MIKLSAFLLAVISVYFVKAQYNTDGGYQKSLKEVLTGIENKYGVAIKYADSMVLNKTVNYAAWRYRIDVETTLDNVLAPLDMKVKKEKDKVYKLSYYEYYRWNVEEGWAELDRIAAQYTNINDWEKRKQLFDDLIQSSKELFERY